MKKYIDNTIKWLVFIYVAALPWIFMVKEVHCGVDEQMLFPKGLQGMRDMFLYGKALFTIVVGAVLLVLLIIELAVYKYKLFDMTRLKDKIIAGCVGVYVVCTVLSYLFARYKSLALTGGVNNFEGTVVLLAYIVIFLAARFACANSRNIEAAVEKLVLIEAVILSVLTAVECMYVPIAQIVAGHELKTEYENMISLTFYNPSYCAVFTILLVPFCMYFMAKASSVIKSIVWSVLAITSVTGCFLTRSTAAFYLVIAQFVVFAIVRVVEVVKTKEKSGFKYVVIKAVTIAVTLLIVFAANVATGNRLFRAVKSSSVNKTDAIHKTDYFKVTDIKVEGNTVTIKGTDSQLQCIINDNASVQFESEEGDVIDVTVKDDVITFPAPYELVSANVENDALCFDLGYKGKLRFLMYNNKFYPMTVDGSVIKDISGTQGDYTKFDSLFTGRGFIWRNTLPILKNTIFLGHGAATFEMYFKQFDYVGLLNSQGNVDLIVDKPHCWYLQMAVNQGVLCMLAVMLMLACIVISAIKDKGNLAAIIAIAAFCVFAIITDSYITVNPVMWAVLGLLSVTKNNVVKAAA